MFQSSSFPYQASADDYSGLPINVWDSHNAELCKTIGGSHRFALILRYAQDDKQKSAIRAIMPSPLTSKPKRDTVKIFDLACTRHYGQLGIMQRIFSSAAKGTCAAKKSSSGAGELKIHWTKPPAGCRLWVLYGERESQLGGTDRR